MASSDQTQQTLCTDARLDRRFDWQKLSDLEICSVCEPDGISTGQLERRLMFSDWVADDFPTKTLSAALVKLKAIVFEPLATY